MQAFRPARRPIHSPFTDYETAAAAVRAALGVNRLTPTLAAEVRAAVARHEARRGNRPAPAGSIVPRLRERLRAEVETAVSTSMGRLFRHARSSWAGGETTDHVTISDTPAARGVTGKVWSSNGKWSGLDLDRHVAVMSGWRRRGAGRGLSVVDGLLTTHLEPVHSTGDVEVYRAAWVRQGRGYDLVAETGHLAYHRPSGTAYHAADPTPDGAVKAARGLARKLKAQAIPAAERDAAKADRARKAAERKATALGRLVERIARYDLAAIAEVIITRRDSLAAGNCVPGTDAFIDRYFPGRTSATIGEVAAAVGRLDPATLAGADLTLARQLGAACLVAIRRDRNAARTLDREFTNA